MCTILTEGAIRQAIASYKRDDEEWFRPDATLKQTLEQPISFVLSKVWLIATWGHISTQGFSFRDQSRTARVLHRERETLQTASQFTEDDWLHDGQVMDDAIDSFSEEILKPPGTRGRQLSFISKFLHWAINPAYPIWDSYARLAMEGLSYDVSEITTWESYKKWAAQIRKEILYHEEALRREREDGETLVRTFDKVLWSRGNEEDGT